MVSLVNVIVNGEPCTFVNGVTIAALVEQLGLNQRRIAVEVNLDIVARELYSTYQLAENDRVEIVHFVGGG